MRTSQEGVDFIKQREGFRSAPYLDGANVWTIGYGTTKGVNKFMEPISREHAESLLRKDVEEFEDAINDLVKVELNQNQYDALVSLVYNIGSGAFAKSTLLKKLNQGKYDEVPYELSRWNKITVAGQKRVSAGLSNRRAMEVEMFTRHEPAELVGGGEVARDVPSIVNKENVSAVMAGASGIGLSNMSGDSPISWALAGIMVVGAGVFLYLFLRRRGA